MSNLCNDKLQGAVVLLCGVYGLLLAYGILPRKPKYPQKAELWRYKYSKIMKVLSPIVIIFGILLLFGILS